MGRGLSASVTKLRKLFVREVIADVFAEVFAFRFGGEKVSVLYWREIEVAIDLATMELQIKPSA